MIQDYQRSLISIHTRGFYFLLTLATEVTDLWARGSDRPPLPLPHTCIRREGGQLGDQSRVRDH